MMNKRRLTKKTLLIDCKIASIICLSSGITDINLNTLNTLSNLKTKKLELLGMGIKDIVTIIVSKMFHPLLKKFDFIGSPINRIKISITKNIVMT